MIAAVLGGSCADEDATRICAAGATQPCVGVGVGLRPAVGVGPVEATVVLWTARVAAAGGVELLCLRERNGR